MHRITLVAKFVVNIVKFNTTHVPVPVPTGGAKKNNTT